MTAYPLLRHRHEAFAQGVAAGLSASQSYAQAYGRERDGTTRACGARLLANVSIQQRIAEIRTAAASDAGAVLSSVIPGLEVLIKREIAKGGTERALGFAERLARLVEAAR